VRASGVFAPLLVLLVVVLVFAAPGLAAAQPIGCTDQATVSWDTDPEASTVLRAHVSVPGCSDGEGVGLQLLLDEEVLPSDPLVRQVTDEHAVFDLTSLAVGIEPVTGVRILLYGDVTGDEGPLPVEIEVEQRYFNAPGREQVGLRRSDVLTVPVGDTYVVPQPGAAYETVPCANVGVDTAGIIAEGVGVFEATEGGRHLACHRRTGPGAAERPTSVGPIVLAGGTAPAADVATEGVDRRALDVDAPAATGGGLARTGERVLVLLAVGLAAIVVGASGITAPRWRPGGKRPPARR
jgi:hypothetical protein